MPIAHSASLPLLMGASPQTPGLAALERENCRVGELGSSFERSEAGGSGACPHKEEPLMEIVERRSKSEGNLSSKAITISSSS